MNEEPDITPKKQCPHMEFIAFVQVDRIEDTKKFYATVKIQCKDCNQPFHFPGFPHGALRDGPSVNVTGTELRTPIRPGCIITPNFLSVKYEV